MISEETIKALEKLGFNRWTKGNIDRLYISASKLGLVCAYYKTGNISTAEFQGERISNSKAGRMMGAKTFLDLKADKVTSNIPELKEEAEKIINEVKGEL